MGVLEVRQDLRTDKVEGGGREGERERE